MTTRRAAATEHLFVTEEELSVIVLGKGRLADWKRIAPILEQRGFPKIDAVLGLRYFPAVRAFFDHDYGLTDNYPLQPPHKREADYDAWHSSKRKPGRQSKS